MVSASIFWYPTLRRDVALQRLYTPQHTIIVQDAHLPKFHRKYYNSRKKLSIASRNLLVFTFEPACRQAGFDLIQRHK